MERENVTLEERIEHVAASAETVESARWRVWESLLEIVADAPHKRARVELERYIGRRLGRSLRSVQTWLRAVTVVPAELRHPYLPVGTVLWATENCGLDAARWLERAHDEGWSLAELQRQVLGEEQKNATTPTLRRVVRAVALELPDEPISPVLADEVAEAVRRAVEPYLA